MRFFLFLMAVLVSGCASAPTEKTGYLSDADYAGVTEGQKGGLRMTLVRPPQELSVFTYTTVVVARIDPNTRRVHVRNASGAIDETAFGFLKFAGEGEPSTSAVALAPGYYAPVAIATYSPATPQINFFKVNGQTLVSSFGDDGHMSVLMNAYDPKATVAEPARVTCSFWEKFSWCTVTGKAKERIKPERLHGLTLGSKVPLWAVTRGKILDLGRNDYGTVRNVVNGFTCLYDKETYALLAENDRRLRSGSWNIAMGQTDESVSFDPTLRKGMQLCPDAETMKRTTYFLFYPAGNVSVR